MRVIFSISVSVNVSQLLSNLNLYNTLLTCAVYGLDGIKKTFIPF